VAFIFGVMVVGFIGERTRIYSVGL
jgi:hypothetical protein